MRESGYRRDGALPLARASLLVSLLAALAAISCDLVIGTGLGARYAEDIDVVDGLPEGRMTSWKPGVTYNGGIPARSSSSDVYVELSPSGGDDTAAVQAALDACPEGMVVLLGPGDFLIGRGESTVEGLMIDRSGVTLRGSGPDITRLVQRDGAAYPVIGMGHRWVKCSTGRRLAADATKGSRVALLSDASGLKPGEIVIVNQVSDDSSRDDEFVPVRLVYYGELLSDPADVRRGWFCEGNRPIGQTMEIESVSGDRVTFTTPFHVGFEKALGAHLCRFKADGGSDSWSGSWDYEDGGLDAVEYSGIEDLAVANGGGGDGGGDIHLWACAYCWVRNVDASGSTGHSCNVESSFRCEVRDSYFHDTADPNPGGGGYGVGLNVYSSDCLFENNIVWGFNKLTIGRCSGGGNVFGYNYLQDGYGDGYREIPEVGMGPNHFAGSHMELFEGNECFAVGSESYWGNAVYVTYFRNQATGLRVSASPLALQDSSGRKAVGIARGAWWYSFAGNVLGYEGMSLLGKGTDFHGNSFDQREWAYEVTEDNLAAFNASDRPLVPMWVVGAEEDSIDPLVRARTFRNGNFDYVTGTTVWDERDAVRRLPDSLYITGGKPAFFGAETWPWVTPENSSSPISGELPAKARFARIKGL